MLPMNIPKSNLQFSCNIIFYTSISIKEIKQKVMMEHIIKSLVKQCNK